MASIVKDIYGLSPSALLQASLQEGTATSDILLLERCQALAAELSHAPLHTEVAVALHKATEKWRRGEIMRWLDIPGQHSLTAKHKKLDDLRIALKQSRMLRLGETYATYVEVPVYNEVQMLPYLVDSIKRQTISGPVALVVADNNSSDATREYVLQAGGNVVHAPLQGIGPARQAARNEILQRSPVSLERAIIVQTDADCYLGEGYLQSVKAAFKQNSHTLITIGPSVYRVPKRHTVDVLMDMDELMGMHAVPPRGMAVYDTFVELRNGQEYRDFTGAKSLREYFEICGRDIDDYLLGKRHPVFIGPNTAYRASLFVEHPIGYPNDKRWEQHYFSIELQRRIPVEDVVTYLEGQCMYVSARGFVRDATERSGGELGTFSDPHNEWRSLSTVKASIQAIDREVYRLADGEHIEVITEETEAVEKAATCRRHADHNVVPARHGSTGASIAGKFAVVAS